MSNTSISLIGLLIKGIPEGLLDVLAIYIFTRTPVNLKKYLIISSIFIVTIFTIRWLPIKLGVTTILSLLILIVIFITIQKVDLPKLIKSIIMMAIMLIACEELNFTLLIVLFGKSKFQEILNSPFELSLYGIPSTILFGIAIFISYRILKKIDKKKQMTKENEIIT